MSGFFSKLFGKAKDPREQGSVGLTTLASDSKRGPGRRQPPTELDWSKAEYIPLPPSPPTWELDGRNEFQREYEDPGLGPVIRAGLKGEDIKVVKLAARLTPEQREGHVGEVIARAYSKIIVRQMKIGQLIAAAKQSVEMFEVIPDHVKDVDRRRFNRILAQLDKVKRKHDFTPIDVSGSCSAPLFTLSYNAPWTLVGERRLGDDERPDPDFDISASDINGSWLSKRSRSDGGHSDVRILLRRIDRRGKVIGERGLHHDAYRTGTAVGSNIAIMDSDGIVHVYDTQLKAIAEINLRDDPRVVDHFRTIETNYWGEFKSQVRAVDAGPAAERYLFTLADEAWCCTIGGRALWGVVMPLKEGWKRVVKRSEHFGAPQEIESALRLFGLSLPVDPADIKRQYRKLAMAHHPDRHPGDQSATEKMKALNKAFEILTGVDPNTLDFEESDITYFARTGPDYVTQVGPIRLEVTITGGAPQDWVYAASFASDGGVYVATYSGKVILLSNEGRPEVVYDIGTCPSEIVNVGRHTYFVTRTRLYVVEEKTKLVAFLDVFQQGRLITSTFGFGLLSGKRFQWFTHAGEKVAEITARDPIRAIHAGDFGAVAMTRQHQVEVHGLSI
jgi:hypothetical protein